jgi:hypothetical protein
MQAYQRTESVLSPSSLRERHVKTEVLTYPVDIDFTSLNDDHYRSRVDVQVVRSDDGLPSFVELHYPWHMDATHTTIVRYTRVANDFA